MAEEYNGYKNYETWNVMLYIANEYGLYSAAVDFMSSYKGRNPYDDFIEYMGLEGQSTPDGVRWDYFRIDRREANEEMRDYGTHRHGNPRKRTTKKKSSKKRSTKKKSTKKRSTKKNSTKKKTSKKSSTKKKATKKKSTKKRSSKKRSMKKKTTKKKSSCSTKYVTRKIGSSTYVLCAKGGKVRQISRHTSAAVARRKAAALNRKSKKK